MEDWPIYYKNRLYKANLKANIAIVTLWSPMYTILPKLDQNKFCIGGQLYSKRGINFIIRNILANPIIDTIIICGSNLSGSVESLINFVKNGIDENYNVIGVDKSKIDSEIPREYLESFRKNVKIVNLTGEFRPECIQEEVDRLYRENKNPWVKPEIFPESEQKLVEKFPSEKTTYHVRAQSIKDAWVQILRLIMKFGSKKGVIKIGEVKELVNLITVIEGENPNNPDIPEWFNFDKEDLKLYYQSFFAKEATSEDYNYGQRIFSYPFGIPNNEYKSSNNSKTAKKFHERFGKANVFDGFTLNQLEEVYLKLKNYKYDRGAIISIWNPWVDNIAKGWQADDQAVKSGNVPCMTQLQFAYREHKLHLTAYFRSNDMFDAWPRNAFALRKLQFDLAKKLDMEPGFLTTISALAQIYETNFSEAENIIHKFQEKVFCRYDMRGNFIIEIEGNEIVARHMDPSGNQQIEEFRIDGMSQRAAIRLGDMIINNLGISEIQHAMDLGRELQKAEIAVKNGLNYVQDQDLKL